MPIPNYIAGRWIHSTSSDSLPIVNPATGEVLESVPLSTAADVGTAVAAAVQAFPAWRNTPVTERIQVLFRLKGLLEANLDSLAETMTREHGKTKAESVGEIRRGIESITHACAIPTLMMGATLENIAAGIDCETIRHPWGSLPSSPPTTFR